MSNENVYVADTETTGFVEPIMPIQLAYLRLNGRGPLAAEVMEEKSYLFNPGKKIEYGAMATHGITNEDVKKRPPWGDFKWTAPVEYLIGHSIQYDWDVMSPSFIGDYAEPKLICTHALSTIVFPDCDSHKLGALMHYLIDQKKLSKATLSSTARKWLGSAHEAIADLKMSLAILQAIAHKTGMREWAELHALSTLGQIPTTMRFGKHKGEEIAKIPGDYKAWALGPKGMTDMDSKLRQALKMSRAEWDLHFSSIRRLLGEAA